MTRPRRVLPASERTAALKQHLRKARSSPEPSRAGWSEPFKSDKTLRVCAGCGKKLTLDSDPEQRPHALWFSNDSRGPLVWHMGHYRP